MGTETFVPLNLVAELNGVLALKQILECTVVILLNRVIVIMRSAYFETGTCRIRCLLFTNVLHLLVAVNLCDMHVRILLFFFLFVRKCRCMGPSSECPLALKKVAASYSHVQNSCVLWNVCCSSRRNSSGYVGCLGRGLWRPLCYMSAVFCFWSRN